MAANPIDKGQREAIMGAERRVKEATDLIIRCKACGIDVSDREEQLVHMIERLTALRDQFIDLRPISQAKV